MRRDIGGRFSRWRVIKCVRDTTNLQRICIYRGSCYILRVASDYRNKWRRPLSLAWERMRARESDAARSERIPKALEALDVTLLCHWPVLGGAHTSWCHSNALARSLAGTRVYAWLTAFSGVCRSETATHSHDFDDFVVDTRPVQRHLKFRNLEIARTRDAGGIRFVAVTSAHEWHERHGSTSHRKWNKKEKK